MIRNTMDAKGYKETWWQWDIKAFLLLYDYCLWLLGTITRSAAIASYSAAAIKKDWKDF